jgi:hypothetical protein
VAFTEVPGIAVLDETVQVVTGGNRRERHIGWILYDEDV